MEHKDKLVELLSDKYGWTEEKIMSAEDFQELGMDSLSVYSLITDIEDMTGFKFETNDITEVSSPMKILEYMDKNFKKGVKTLKVTSNSKKSAVIRSLKRKKTYYFRIRTINAKSASLVSAWSKVKKVKIK